MYMSNVKGILLSSVFVKIHVHMYVHLRVHVFVYELHIVVKLTLVKIYSVPVYLACKGVLVLHVCCMLLLSYMYMYEVKYMYMCSCNT